MSSPHLPSSHCDESSQSDESTPSVSRNGMRGSVRASVCRKIAGEVAFSIIDSADEQFPQQSLARMLATQDNLTWSTLRSIVRFSSLRLARDSVDVPAPACANHVLSCGVSKSLWEHRMRAHSPEWKCNFVLTKRLSLVVTSTPVQCETRVQTRSLCSSREMMFMIPHEVLRSVGLRRWVVNHVSTHLP